MTTPTETEIARLLSGALRPRLGLINENHDTAFRLFNGFYEGLPTLVADVYARTLVLFSYCEDEVDSIALTQTARDFYLDSLPWIKSVVVKHRLSPDGLSRKGLITFGGKPDEQILENGIRYAVDLQLNQDASFYLDTHGLRSWLLENAGGLDVLNTFAYTGSLGVAALFGGARRVVQMDRSQKFLDLARSSAALNHLDFGKMKLAAVDFFVGMGQLKRAGASFDLAIIDPPFFSITEKGVVDQVTESHRLINKIRPLIKDGGRIVAINNALFVSGKQYLDLLEKLGGDGYLSVDELISIPEDFTGFTETRVIKPPADPAPFNHPTKIAVLRVKRKG